MAMDRIWAGKVYCKEQENKLDERLTTILKIKYAIKVKINFSCEPQLRQSSGERPKIMKQKIVESVINIVCTLLLGCFNITYC
jgi:hypothetical protein